MTPLQKLPMNGEDLGNLIAAKGFKKLSKVQYIAQSGHTAITGLRIFAAYCEPTFSDNLHLTKVQVYPRKKKRLMKSRP